MQPYRRLAIVAAIFATAVTLAACNNLGTDSIAHKLPSAHTSTASTHLRR